MTPASPPTGTLADVLRAGGRWLAGWWRAIHLGALLGVLVLSPSSWGAPHRRAMARHIDAESTAAVMAFTVLTTLISLVLIRIVLVTALSYGLTQYALEMVVRVLVLELIPLTAALFAALRCTLPDAAEVAALRSRHPADPWSADGLNQLRGEVLPRLVAGLFCALLLAVVSCVVTLLVAYLSVYGFTLAGLANYTRTVGHVFSPAVSLIFGLKIAFLSIAVAVMPMAAALEPAPRRRSRTSAELQGLVRMFLVILLIEAASLIGNYA